MGNSIVKKIGIRNSDFSVTNFNTNSLRNSGEQLTTKSILKGVVQAKKIINDKCVEQLLASNLFIKQKKRKN